MATSATDPVLGDRWSAKPSHGLKETMNIYVGNLSLKMTEEELRREFVSFGEVASVTIMDDNYIDSGQKRVYGFVEMPSKSEAKAAITALNAKRLGQMTITVIEALPLSDSSDKNCRSDNRNGRHINRARQRTYRTS